MVACLECAAELNLADDAEGEMAERPSAGAFSAAGLSE